MASFENFPITDKQVHHGKLLTVLVCTLVVLGVTIAGLFVYYKPERVKVNIKSAAEIQAEISDKISQTGAPVSQEVAAKVKSSISTPGVVSTSSREEIIKELSN
jgi:cell division protein FtsX